MATAAPQKVECVACKRRTELPSYLDCGHVYCRNCYTHVHNEYVLHIYLPSLVAGDQTPPEQIPCGVCGVMSRVPGARPAPGVAHVMAALSLDSDQKLVQTDKQTSGAGLVGDVRETKHEKKSGLRKWLNPKLFNSKQKKDQTDTESGKQSFSGPLVAGRREGSGVKPVSGVKPTTNLKLLWHNTDFPHIRDVTFFGEGQIVYIKYDKREEDEEGWTLHGKELRVMDLQGRPAELPFPVFITKPYAVCGSRDGSSLAVIDWPGTGKYHINVYRRVGGKWRSTQITTTDRVYIVSLTSTGECVCASSQKVMLYGTEGHMLWSRSLPGEGNYRPWLCTTSTGLIVISNPKVYKITVHDMKGTELHQFSGQFLKEPFGVCTDGADQVLVYDAGTRTISVFNTEGDYSQKLLKLNYDCSGLSLLRDSHLVISTIDDGLYLYALQP